MRSPYFRCERHDNFWARCCRSIAGGKRGDRQHVARLCWQRPGRQWSGDPAAPGRAAPKLALVEPPQIRPIFVMRPSRFFDASIGRQKILGRYRIFDVPISIAERAIRSGAAIAISDLRVKQLQSMAQMIEPDAARCNALEDSRIDAKQSSSAPIMSTSEIFTPLDRGSAFNVVMPVPAAAAAQSVPDDAEG